MTHDFRCSCGYEITLMAKITDTITPPICIACRKEMTKDYAPPPIHLKGTGWGKDS